MSYIREHRPYLGADPLERALDHDAAAPVAAHHGVYVPTARQRKQPKLGPDYGIGTSDLSPNFGIEW